MSEASHSIGETAPISTTITGRQVAAGKDWAAMDFLCTAGPEIAPFEERHNRGSITLVTGGTFRYRTEAGEALLYPGALMLGQHGACYECGHVHGRGDRCLSFQFEPELLAEIAASQAGGAKHRFKTPMLPSLDKLNPLLAALLALNAEPAPDPAWAEELALRLAETAFHFASGADPRPIRPSALDQKRLSRALRHIETNAAETLTLDALAAEAAMSKYHFLRVFRQCLGQTPYDYLLGLRLRRAALMLATSDQAIAGIAYDAGFGDLSGFNHRFRRSFGKTPRAWREQHSLHRVENHDLARA